VVQRYPALVDGAFIIIAWVGAKLGIEYLHDAHYISFEIPRWLSLGLIVVIFLIAFIYARMQGPVDDPLTENAERILEGEAAHDTRRGGSLDLAESGLPSRAWRERRLPLRGAAHVDHLDRLIDLQQLERVGVV